MFYKDIHYVSIKRLDEYFLLDILSLMLFEHALFTGTVLLGSKIQGLSKGDKRKACNGRLDELVGYMFRSVIYCQ